MRDSWNRADMRADSFLSSRTGLSRIITPGAPDMFLPPKVMTGVASVTRSESRSIPRAEYRECENYRTQRNCID